MLYVSVWELREDIYKIDVTDVSSMPVQTVRAARVGFYAHRCLDCCCAQRCDLSCLPSDRRAEFLLNN
jgi:hypothetical protein